MADEKYRLKTRLPNGAEFEAEGTESVVQALFDKFLEASRLASPGQPVEIKASDAGTATEEARVDRSISEARARVFAEDRAGDLSLTALPRTANRDADSLLVLLYGYDRIKDQHSITGGALKKAARQSGIQLDRVDRLLAPYGPLVNIAGFKKGRRYGLNNQGIKKAEELLDQIIG